MKPEIDRRERGVLIRISALSGIAAGTAFMVCGLDFICILLAIASLIAAIFAAASPQQLRDLLMGD